MSGINKSIHQGVDQYNTRGFNLGMSRVNRSIQYQRVGMSGLADQYNIRG